MQPMKTQTKPSPVKIPSKKTKVFGKKQAQFNDSRSYEYHIELRKLKVQSKREKKLM
jgi:hypothetical protein